MQPSTAPAPSPRSPDFAGVLMDLAVPEAKKPPARDLDGLEEDVAVLSYEKAVRQHGRYRAGAANPGLPFAFDLQPDLPVAGAATATPGPGLLDRRTASVTVRLCHSESERLRLRAAESGLTVSEYLRSCVFEVESLRAQVKEALAALRAHKKMQHPWWRRLWMQRGGKDTAA